MVLPQYKYFFKKNVTLLKNSKQDGSKERKKVERTYVFT